MQDKYRQTIRLLNQMVTEQIVPGVSYAIFDGSHMIKRVVGMAEVVPQKIPLRDGMQYDLASLTKVIGTVPVIAILLQAGALHLDDSVCQYLPEVQNSEVRIRNLITHTAAIEGYIPHRNELPADQLLTSLLTMEQIGSNLNKNILYTDIGFIYLGLIAERIWGQPIQVLSQRHVFRPLGMTRTTYVPHWQDCVPTEVQNQRGLIRGQAHDPKGYILQRHCGSAGLFSTLDDLLKFSHALLETNLDHILTTSTVEMMFHDQTPLHGDHNRGLGWKLLHARTPDQHPIISHTGFTGTWIILDQQTDQGMVVLSNRVHPRADNDDYLNYRGRIMANYLMEKDQ
ncbi:serine hydrolase domain-containing protein [Limosilactobacillus caecicola]|uniref:serine hydrolase domain-containing protein n=1 Tax=Limosilactobacillus caecicola TaxID=2941332 RepID=UPI00203BE347|nr:serine hydrolase domain-containing protein [Limosilactobacillus caecicola]